MKIALIGQDIPSLLPSLLADILFAGRQAVQLWAEERNGAMRDVLQRYGDAVVTRSGLAAACRVEGRRSDVLRGADCVLYAGDLMPSSRFRQDQEALGGAPDNPDDEGLSDQARVRGGLGGLMHTLRQGEQVYSLCDDMDDACPGAAVITLGQPVARTAAMFARRGYAVYGLGDPLEKGPNGLSAIAKALGQPRDQLRALTAGLPDFSFLLALRDAQGRDLLPRVHALAEEGSFGRLPMRWLRQYGALAVGSTVAHAELLPAQEDFRPEPNPSFGESVERRKERILWMNTVGEQGLEAREGQMAQLLLLSRAPAQRPGQLALGLLRREPLSLPAVAMQNLGQLQGLPREAIVEAPLLLENAARQLQPITLPGELTELCAQIDEVNRLSAAAAAGDREALRECVECDPALAGLDRLYALDVAERMIAMHSDVLSRWSDSDEE